MHAHIWNTFNGILGWGLGLRADCSTSRFYYLAAIPSDDITTSKAEVLTARIREIWHQACKRVELGTDIAVNKHTPSRTPLQVTCVPSMTQFSCKTRLSDRQMSSDKINLT
jgi:hypothetical protein